MVLIIIFIIMSLIIILTFELTSSITWDKVFGGKEWNETNSIQQTGVAGILLLVVIHGQGKRGKLMSGFSSWILTKICKYKIEQYFMCK